VPGLLTLEEGRAALRRPAQPPVTDTILMTLGQQLVPVAAAVLDPRAFDAAKQAAAEADGASDAEGGDAGDEPSDQPDGGEGERTQQRALTMALPDPKRAHWERQIKLLDADEVTYAAQAMRQFRVEKRGVGATYARAGETAARAQRSQTGDPDRARATSEVLRDYAPGGAYHEEWRRRFEELIGRTYRAGTAAEMVGTVGLDFQLPNAYVQRAIQERALRLANYVTETTAQQITSVVAAAERAGLSVAETGTLIETHRACMVQGRIPIGQAFTANGMQFPMEPGAPAGEVINCRCRPIFYVEAADEALI
jgi:hypothetical protein